MPTLVELTKTDTMRFYNDISDLAGLTIIVPIDQKKPIRPWKSDIGIVCEIYKLGREHAEEEDAFEYDDVMIQQSRNRKSTFKVWGIPSPSEDAIKLAAYEFDRGGQPGRDELLAYRIGKREGDFWYVKES